MADLQVLKSYVKSNNQDGLLNFLSEKNVGGIGYNELCPNFEDYYILKDLLKNGNKDMAMTCINAGFRVYPQISKNRLDSVMHLAVVLGCPDVVQLLLNRKVDLYLKNSYGETPLILAATCGNDQITKMILSRVDSENYASYENFSHFHVACMQNCVDKVKNYLIFGTDINQAVKGKSLYNPGFTGLHFAVQARSFETVEFLVNSGADMTIKDQRGLTPLHLAFRMRNNRMINALLSVQHFFMSNPVDPTNLSHFHIACAMNNLDVVKDFAEKKLQIDHEVSYETINRPHKNAFSFAIQNDCVDVIKYLVTDDRFVDWKFADHMLTCAYVQGNVEIIRLIESMIDKNIVSAECKGVMNDNKCKVAKRNFNLDSNVNCHNDVKRIKLSQYTDLHLSVIEKNQEKVSLILNDYHHSIILTKDVEGRTPLHLAFETQQKEIIVQMLKLHSTLDENPVDKRGLSHFHIACTIKESSTAIHFMKNGADVNIPVKMDSPIFAGWTPLHFAVASQSSEMIRVLLKNGADYTVKNAAGLSSFDLAIPGDTKFLMRDADDGEDEWQCAMQILSAHHRRWRRDNFNDRGINLLHIACAMDDVDAVHRLVATDALNEVIDADVELWGGHTPLHIAVHYDSQEAMKILLDNNADVSIQTVEKRTAAANVWADEGFIDERLYITSKNLYNEDGISQLHLVCESITDISALQHFLNMGVDVNEAISINCGITHAGKTPLHLAVGRRNDDMVKLLLERGADIHARDCNLNTPLHECQSSKSLNLLIQYGADLHARNCDLESALSSASQWCEDDEFLTALFEYGLDLNDRTRYGDCMINFNRLNLSSLIVAAKHIGRLLVLGVKINESTIKAFGIARSRVYTQFIRRFDAGEFGKQCREELKSMIMIKVDDCTTLYDLLSKNTYSMVRYLNNETVKQLIQSEMDLKKDYPIYAYLLILQFKRGLERTSLLQDAEKSLRILSRSSLLVDEMHFIFRYLNNRELKYLNKSVKGLD